MARQDGKHRAGDAGRRRLLVLGAVAALAALPCQSRPAAAQTPASAPSGLPPLLATPTNEHHPGKMVFAQLTTPDLAGAERFYGALFGWQFRAVPVQRTRYASVLLGGQVIGGMVERPLPPGGTRAPAWLGLVSTNDVAATAASATQHGARLLYPPRPVPGLGEEAVLADPQGAVFGLLHSGSGDPPDVLADPGDWIWSALLTTDPDAAATFYQAVLGYGVYDVAAPAERQHLILASDEYARASVNPFPSNSPGARPGWIRFVRVADAAATAARTTGLGGRVLVPPHPDRDGNLVALLADPQGAAFGIMTWTDTDAPAGAAK